MDYAKLYRKEWAEFQAQARLAPRVNRPVAERPLHRWAQRVARLFRGRPEPEDPYAYATAPKRPRLPRRGASAAADPYEG